MRKAILISLLAAIAVLSVGCAMTAYPVIDLPVNKSHGLVDCRTDDRFANTQQNTERDMLDNLQYVVPESCGSFYCTPTGVPISAQDAKAWGRFIGMWIFAAELGATGCPTPGDPGCGHWATSGVMDLPDGSRRISTWYRSVYSSSWSCGAGAFYRPGGSATEGNVAGDKFRDPNWTDWLIQTVAIDTATSGYRFGENIVAVTPAQIGYGYAVFAAQTARSYEGRENFTPVTRREGLADFFAGQPLTFAIGELSVTAHASLDANGAVTMFVDALAANGAQYTAENPLSFRFPNNNFKTIEFDRSNTAEQANLFRFLLESGLTDRPLELGQFIPELGTKLPSLTIWLNSGWFENYINNGPGADGGTGFGG